jgi:hypothetical protein
VRGSSASDVYATGGSGLIFHSSGDGNWSLQAQSDMGALFMEQLPDVRPITPSDVYSVGINALVIHSTGKDDWAPQALPQLTALPASVWASGPTDVYVVTGGDFFDNHPALEMRQGSDSRHPGTSSIVFLTIEALLFGQHRGGEGSATRRPGGFRALGCRPALGSTAYRFGWS